MKKHLAILFVLSAMMVFAFASARAENATNFLAWQTATDRVSADVHGEALWPLLEDIAHQTGWHIFVEPDVQRTIDVKFRDLPRGEALRKLLGDLNFAFVPQTNGPDFLYVFTSRMENATRAMSVPASVKAPPQRHSTNELILKVKPGTDIDALAKSLGAKVVGRSDKLGLYKLQFADAAATDAALAQLKNNSDVAIVDYNYIFDPPPTPQVLASSPASTMPKLALSDSTPGDPCSPVVGLIDTQVQSLGRQLDPMMLTPISVVGDLPANTSAVPTHGTAMANALAQALQQSSQGKTPSAFCRWSFTIKAKPRPAGTSHSASRRRSMVARPC